MFQFLKKPWSRFYTYLPKQKTISLDYQHLPQMLSTVIEQVPSKKAFVQVMPNGMQASLSFYQVGFYSDEFALYLREIIGIKEGDRVAVQMPNCLTYPIVSLGILKAGGILVNVNPLSTSYEMKEKFKDCEPKGLVILDMFADRISKAIEGEAIKQVVLVSITEFFNKRQKMIIDFVLKYLKKQVPSYHGKGVSYKEISFKVASFSFKKKSLLKAYLTNINLKTIALLQYTGGTTGGSTKAAVLTHENLISNMVQIEVFTKGLVVKNKELILTALPLYHSFAFTVNFLFFFYQGATNILIPSPRPITNLKKPMLKYPITWFTGVNTLFKGLLDSKWFSKKYFSKLKTSVAGGMALESNVLKRWQAIFPSSLIEGYGLSEASPVVTFNPIGGNVKEGTIGIPLPFTDAKCVNKNGKEVKIKAVGELIVKGPQVMKGYWKKDIETKNSLKKGWLYTGDIAFMDKEGYFKIVDRKKDIIIVSGFNVFPSEVEDCITMMDGVLEVGVVGIKDDKTSEAVKAFIVKKDPSLQVDMIKNHCCEYLSAYKVPKFYEFREELPKTVIGKILRKDLKE